MPKNAILHDTRLNGVAPYSDYVLAINNSIPLDSVFTKIKSYAMSQSGPITLEIMCHGFESHSDTIGQQSLTDSFGGGGLQLGAEDFTLTTVSKASVLFGSVSSIIVYACGAAHTRPGYEGTKFDGQKLFKQLSVLTTATVYAADVTQWYYRQPIPLSSSNIIDFRRFEGNLWQFTPDGNSSIIESNQLTAW